MALLATLTWAAMPTILRRRSGAIGGLAEQQVLGQRQSDLGLELAVELDSDRVDQFAQLGPRPQALGPLLGYHGPILVEG